MTASGDATSAPKTRAAGAAGRPVPRRRGPGALWTAAVAALGLAVAVNLATPAVVTPTLRLALRRAFGTNDVHVAVSATPPAALWWGYLDMLSVHARSLHVGNLDVAAFDATLRHIDVDPIALYGRGIVVTRSFGSGAAHVTVSGANLASMLAAQPSVKEVAVRLRPGAVVLDGTVSVLGAFVRASATAHLVLRDVTHLDLVLDRVMVGGLQVPPDVAAGLMQSINPVLDVGRLPFGLRLTGVTIGQGVLRLDAVTGAGRAADGGE